MTTRALGRVTWNRMEGLTVSCLSAVLFLEMVAIVLWNPELGRTMASLVSIMASRAVEEVGELWRYIWRMVGPVVFPLVALTAIETVTVSKLFKCRKSCHCETKKIDRLYRILRIVENASPGFGFLGTCLSLINTMADMDPKLSQSAMLKGLLENSSSAFGSTVYGISLALSAFIFHELFKGFLLSKDNMKEQSFALTTTGTESSSMSTDRRQEEKCVDC